MNSIYLGWEDPLEKEMATSSSILAWRIWWATQSMGSQESRLDLVTQQEPNTQWEIIILNLSTNSSTQPLINF